MGWQRTSKLDDFLNSLDDRECKLLVLMFGDLHPYDITPTGPRYTVPEQALIGRMQDALIKLQIAGELPASKEEL